MSEQRLVAYECANGHLTYPSHPVCPTCGEPQTGTVDLTDRTADVRSWTTVTTTPPGVREPNTLALVAFTVGDREVCMLAGASDDVAVGDTVEPVFVEELRDPEECIRARQSQHWDGFRVEPL